MLAHPPFHQQQQPAQQSAQQQQQQPTLQQQLPSSSSTAPSHPDAPLALHQQPSQPQAAQPQPPGTFQTLRLRDDPPPVTQPAPRTSRKRKSPPTADPQQSAPPPPGLQHPSAPMSGLQLPPPHVMVHPNAHMGQGPLPHGYQYVPNEYAPGPIQQMPPPHPGPAPIQTETVPDQQSATSPGGANRTLSQSKRAEQNRKAQRAFRERRDQHVKALESRSQLLDAALASADEANRRWEECRALVDQLRIENAALRAAINQAHAVNGQGSAGGTGAATNAPPPDQSPTTAIVTSADGGGENHNDGNAS